MAKMASIERDRRAVYSPHDGPASRTTSTAIRPIERPTPARRRTRWPSVTEEVIFVDPARSLFVGLLVGGLRVLVRLLAVLLRRRRVLFGGLVLAHLVMVCRLQMMVRRRRMVRCRLVMTLVGRVLGLGR